MTINEQIKAVRRARKWLDRYDAEQRELTHGDREEMTPMSASDAAELCCALLSLSFDHKDSRVRQSLGSAMTEDMANA